MPAQDIEDIYPLSPLQEGMLFHCLRDPGSPVFFEQESYPLHGTLNISAFRRSWQAILDRHSILRSSFHWEGLGSPVQVVHRRVELPFDIHDWQDCPRQERQQRLRLLLASDRAKRFDFSQAPLIRLALVQLSAELAQFVFSFHHILLDGWSHRIVMEELWVIYESYCAGGDGAQLAPVRPYAEFVTWLQQQDMAKAERFWRGVLNGVDTPTRLSIERPINTDSSVAVEQADQTLRLSRRCTAQLQSIAREQRLTMNTIVQGAWANLLSRYSNNGDVVFGVVVSGRPPELDGVESMVGLFINTLPLRAHVPPNQLLLPWLRDLQTQQFQARNYEYTPMVNIQQWAGMPAGLPLFDSIVIFENYPVALVTADDEEAENSYSFEESNYPVTLMVVPGPGLSLKVLYSAEQFDRDAIARLIGHLQALLEGIADDPFRLIGDLPLLSAREERQLIRDWNSTGSEYPSSVSIAELFDEQVMRTPRAPAFFFEGEVLDYAELNRRSNRIAHYLQSRGVGSEALVAICLERSFEFVTTLLGVTKAGAAYVPLDTTYPTERLNYMLHDSAAVILITNRKFLPFFPDLRIPALLLDREQDLLVSQSESNLRPWTDPQSLAYVIYTSGSTGKPKGVAVEYGQILNRLYWMWKAYPFSPNEACCQKTASSFVDSIWELLGPLLKGVPTIIIPDHVLRDAQALTALLAQHKVTRIWTVPSWLRTMLEADRDLRVRLPALTFWVATGEALPFNLCEQFHRQMTGCRLYNLYGTSEIWDATWFDASAPAELHSQVPIGRPISNVEAFVLDSYLRLQPIGVSGELYIAGDGLARGYHHQPAMTAERFIPNLFDRRPGTRLYKTGDRARYLADGNIEFQGRLDDQVKIRGFRIELGELESVLAEHPGVREAAVAVQQSPAGDPRLVAYIVPPPTSKRSQRGREYHESTSEQVSRWREIWDETYRQQPSQTDPTFNLNGWKSSYTRTPISDQEMREWLDHTVQAVRSFAPKKVLDIGCGAGLLLFRIAHDCDNYCATDLSGAAVQYVEKQLKTQHLPQVMLLQRAADDFSGFEPAAFDTIILNSVTQYFPDIAYLMRVLEGAVRITAPGGRILLGDVRSLPLLEAFHASVLLHTAPAALNVAKLRQRVREQMAQEEELAIDPAFFFALKRHLPQITDVHVTPKRGRYRNELTRFRYDVTLHVQSAEESAQAVEWKRWTARETNLPAIRRLLDDVSPQRLGLAYIPNSRVSGEVNILNLLAQFEESKPVSILREHARAAQADGLDPEDVWALESNGSLRVQLHWSGPRYDHCFHAVISAANGADKKPGGALFAEPAMQIDESKPWTAYANHPLEGISNQEFIAQLAKYLRTKVPDYLVPAAFVILDSLPLTPSGKLDRRALPPPEKSRERIQKRYVLPRTQTEEVVAAIWADLLGIERAGAYDNFFELGGHSLLAMRVLSRMREAFHVELPVRAFFDEAPTVAALAHALDQARARGEVDQSPAIARLPREAHTATLLPGGVVDREDLSKARRVRSQSASGVS
jgi:amino acid adenylation domain-containing protein